jgi:hypothetical protein
MQNGTMFLKPASFEKVNFAGAFGTTDWTQGWTEFLPQTVVYY